jgi:hypothetical protein
MLQLLHGFVKVNFIAWVVTFCNLPKHHQSKRWLTRLHESAE